MLLFPLCVKTCQGWDRIGWVGAYGIVFGREQSLLKEAVAVYIGGKECNAILDFFFFFDIW